MRFTRKKRKMLKDAYIRAKKEVNEQFGRKMNQDVDGNRKFFWKMSKANEGKVGRMKDRWRVAVE